MFKKLIYSLVKILTPHLLIISLVLSWFSQCWLKSWYSHWLTVDFLIGLKLIISLVKSWSTHWFNVEFLIGLKLIFSLVNSWSSHWLKVEFLIGIKLIFSLVETWSSHWFAADLHTIFPAVESQVFCNKNLPHICRGNFAHPSEHMVP